MKKWITVLTAVMLVTSIFLVGCGSSNKDNNQGQGTTPKADLKVGMVTDSGTIDDKSFNQGTWEGILAAKNELGITERYLKPAGETDADYLKEIGNLYDAGYKFIVTPGFKFEVAIFQAQDKYKDAKFVLIDGAPHSGEEGAQPDVKDNTVSIFFAEHEAGFMAGVATALQLKEGEAGFIGGLEIPPVQKFNWGFQQGLKYANDNLGTNVTIKAENVIYQGTFYDSAAGQQLAAQMFDRGVKVIHAAAGGVGVGAITEAKDRVKKGEDVWIVGVDIDQYADGVYDEANNKSVILTSAVKKIDHAASDMIKAQLDGEFPGGQILTFDAKNDGVGIPSKNPNLSDDVQKQVDDVFAKLKSGEIKVSGERGDLIK